MMKTLPETVTAYARSATFTTDTVPENLRHAHRTKAGAWAKIIVLEGRLRYRILEPEVCELELSPEYFGVIEPQVPHEVEPLGNVQFYVEFYR